MPTVSPLRKESVHDRLVRLQAERDDYIRRAVIFGRRSDIMAKEVLGLKVAPKLHGVAHEFLNTHDYGIFTAYRGAGKSNGVGIPMVLTAIMAYPDIKITYICRTSTQARRLVAVIKNHLENNETLHRIFGGGWVGPKWTETELTVGRRKTFNSNPTLQAVGAGGAVASAHVNLIIADDLVNELNSRTEVQRENMMDWIKKELLNTLDPPELCEGPWGRYIPYTGEFKWLATIYHPDDPTEQMKKMPGFEGNVLNIPAVDDNWTETPWPERHDLKWMKMRYHQLGAAFFAAQMCGRADQMRGDVIPYDAMKPGLEKVYPGDPNWNFYLGIDPAAHGKSKQACEFAMTVIGVQYIPETDLLDEEEKLVHKLADRGDVAARLWLKKNKGKVQKKKISPRLVPTVRIVDHYSKNIPFGRQIAVINHFIDRWRPVGVGIESNGMQLQQYKQLCAMRPDVNFLDIQTDNSKLLRAYKVSALFQNNTLKLQPGKRTPGVNRLIEQLLQISAENKRWDRFDSLDISLRAADRKPSGVTGSKRKKPEYGVLWGGENNRKKRGSRAA